MIRNCNLEALPRQSRADGGSPVCEPPKRLASRDWTVGALHQELRREVKRVSILGTRGIPGRYGGFETFAEQLALYLREHGWEPTVYCQQIGRGGALQHDEWRGVKRVLIEVAQDTPFGSMVFDLKAVLHALSTSAPLVLTLGYNTAILCLLYRMKGVFNVINMDGLEWKRDKWRWPARVWLWFNERCGCWFADHLIADHPEIQNYFRKRIPPEKMTMIPYGARAVTRADETILARWGLKKNGYALIIARPEPENSILEIMRAFGRRLRGVRLVVLGNYHPDKNAFHRQIISAASSEVLFLGAIYDEPVTDALRFFTRLYIHGHKVGGTNPSLVEAMGAGAAVLAHDNIFNRWAGGAGVQYFSDEESCALRLDQLLAPAADLSAMRSASHARFRQYFTLDSVLHQYERLLADCFAQVS